METSLLADSPLFRVFSKGTTAELEGVRRSENWVVARRGWLRFFSDRLEMGDCHIRYSEIRQATLFRLKTLLGGYVLRVVTAEQTYQFGLNPWALRGRRLPFAHEEQETRVRHSVASVIIWIVAFVSLILWVLERVNS